MSLNPNTINKPQHNHDQMLHSTLCLGLSGPVLEVGFESELEFYSAVSTVKVMLSRSVNLLTLFLGRLSSLSG